MSIDKKAYRETINNVKKRFSKVAVYGLGGYAQFAAQYMSENIVCFCDKSRIDGTFMGKNIMPLSTLPELGVEAVFIATGTAAEQIVYDRICNFCKKNKLPVIGIHSGDLNHVGSLIASHGSDGEANKRTLMHEIEKHDVICFDIFDTLLMRYTLYPSDVFDIVEERAARIGLKLPHGFKNYRSQAESALATKYCGLKEIYDVLEKMVGLPESDVEALMNIEMQVERDATLPRQPMVGLLRYAKNLGKQVILVSDMYLSSAFLRELLSEHGITDYDDLYVSEEREARKGENLFSAVLSDHPAKSYLHIGDNAQADGWGARAHGIDVFLVESALNMFRQSGASRLFKYLGSFNERLLLGIFLSHAYNNPFAMNEKNQIMVRSIPDFARLFLAPLTASFMLWLLHKINEIPYDAILFAARDGYIFEQMYKDMIAAWKIEDAPRSVYLYASRKLCMSIAIQDEDDIEMIYDKFRKRALHFLRDAFQVGSIDEAHNKVSADENGNNFRARKIDKGKIIDASAEKRKAYSRYLASLGLRKGSKCVFFEMSSQGTSQCALAKTVLPNLYGLYMHRYRSADAMTMGRVETFMPQSGEPMLINNVFEMIFTSAEPSAKGIDDDGQIFFEKEIRTEKEIKEIETAQEQVKDYFSVFLKLANRDDVISNFVGQQILEIYRSDAFIGCDELFAERRISDDLHGGTAECLKKDERYH